ncbi:hypothetical protein ACA910_012632 [Epithemia clementina (nom. ined.)]
MNQSLKPSADGPDVPEVAAAAAAAAPISPSQQAVVDLTLLVHRVDLFDTGHNEDDRSIYPPPFSLVPLNFEVGVYDYNNDQNVSTEEKKPASQQASRGRIVACRVPPQTHPSPVAHRMLALSEFTPNPYGPSVDKYWNQRRRLFCRFDNGIQLDEEGWFSVTPEQIADHVALRISELVLRRAQFQSHLVVENKPFIVLDAFCGCGGNAIAFARQPNMVVYAVDTDRNKLRMAAHNAAIYQIPPQKLILIECNVLFILEYCFKDGSFVLDQPISTPEQAEKLMKFMPPPVPCETYAGYSIGGIDTLPRGIDAVFMDPPWGGVDYEVFGKHGYDLERNMKIKRTTPPKTAAAGAMGDDFFDSFLTQPRSKKERISQFNCSMEGEDCVNGAELLALAASATATRWVIYDIPRNTNFSSLGQAALSAGYRGNCKVEEHYLNGRLKTVTAYFGTDWRALLNAGAIHVMAFPD